MTIKYCIDDETRQAQFSVLSDGWEFVDFVMKKRAALSRKRRVRQFLDSAVSECDDVVKEALFIS